MGGLKMNFNEVKELISIIDKSSLKNFELSLDNCNVKMNKTGTVDHMPKENKESYDAPIKQESTVSSKEEHEETAEEEKKTVSGNVVKAPLVGTFYNSAAPGKPVYAPVGKKVKKGDVLCIIEAMKIMNEVVSEFDGEVLEVCVENEQLVEYGQPLFVIG
jgi:acetyl-CoA carboxylase biotin carboxyl carrier protein